MARGPVTINIWPAPPTVDAGTVSMTASQARAAGARLWRTGGPTSRYGGSESAVRAWARSERLDDESTEELVAGWRAAGGK